MTRADHDETSAGMKRRALFGATAGAGLAVAGAGAAVAKPGKGKGKGRRHGLGPASSSGFPRGLSRQFRNPSSATAAGFRWWWPHGLVDPTEIAREVDQVARAGFGVLEIADVTHSLRARNIDIDVSKHGWGTASWKRGVKAALAQGAKRGVSIDITVGPSWPAAVRTITPDSDAACTELIHGTIEVAAGETHEGALPSPALEPHEGVTESHLVTVQAHRVTGEVRDRNGNVTAVLLDRDSYVDLRGEVKGDQLTWTAPADPAEGTWIIFAAWRRGSAQEPEAGPHTSPKSYVVDHFSAAGSKAVIDLWKRTILDASMRRLLRAAGGNLFEDSLEIETEATIWTPRLPVEFSKRRGYGVLPWLPFLVELDEKYLFSVAGTEDPATADAVATNQVRDDFNQTLSDLYLAHHLEPLQKFAGTLGMGLRVQPYGLETDTTEHAAALTVPETESLGFKNLDDYRVLTGGRDIAGRTILSCEAICYNGAAYNTTWGANTTSPTAQNQALFTLNSIFAAGVNQAMIHGFPYADAPEVTWPGFAAFSPYYNGAIGYGEAWGPRTPQWKHIPGIAAYLARTQMVLRTGRPTYDIVFLRQKGWASTGVGPFWVTNTGTGLGWSHSFITAPLLLRNDVRFSGGRLAPNGPAYKVMVIGPDKMRSREMTIDLAAARKVLSLARRGMPVVLVVDGSADWATQALPVGRTDDAAVAEVRRIMRALLALRTTRQVVEAEIGTALDELGVTSDVQHETSTVQHVRRQLGDVDLYYLANARHAENRRLSRVTQDVWLTATDRRAVPWQLDSWSGETRRLMGYERSGNRIRVRVDLEPGESVIIALADPGRSARTPSVRLAEATDVRVRDERTELRVTTPGAHAVTWSDGRRSTVQVDRVREPIEPTDWSLELSDWRPGDSATETVKETHRADLDALGPWSAIAEFADVSGIGRYVTEIDLGEDWRGTDGAVLELGDVNDTFRVLVNGVPLPPCDPLVGSVDLGFRLRPGRNRIEVEVASTLLNRLRVVTPDVYGVAGRQTYGLTGPVRVVPYVQRPIRR
ncbi:alpha-L-rhamnosidase [Nocardioides sp. BGMRC 2183]|nr:alpha-L-rhamnosidase [Nocardioides sp. BGMRC 2183]